MKTKPKKPSKGMLVRAMARAAVGQPRPGLVFRDRRRGIRARIADKERLALE